MILFGLEALYATVARAHSFAAPSSPPPLTFMVLLVITVIRLVSNQFLFPVWALGKYCFVGMCHLHAVLYWLFM
jgi:hypothetical protein